MTPADFTRLAEACERAADLMCEGPPDVAASRLFDHADMLLAAAHFRTLASSPADSAEDAEGPRVRSGGEGYVNIRAWKGSSEWSLHIDTARDLYRKLGPFVADSAEDAAGVAGELEARARVAADGAKVQELCGGNGLGFDLLDREAKLLGRAAALLRSSSAAVAEAVRVAVEKEREECAKVCESMAAGYRRHIGTPDEVTSDAGTAGTAIEIARRIPRPKRRSGDGCREGPRRGRTRANACFTASITSATSNATKTTTSRTRRVRRRIAKEAIDNRPCSLCARGIGWALAIGAERRDEKAPMLPLQTPEKASAPCMHEEVHQGCGAAARRRRHA